MNRLIALVLVLFLSLESFGVAVSDNDGAAFITKAEFDSMRNEFQSQIDEKNRNLDNMLDSAISTYISGIKTTKVSYLTSYLNQINSLCDDFYIDGSGNKVKYGYRTMARKYNVPTTQKPIGAISALFFSKGDIPSGNRSAYFRTALDNSRRTGLFVKNLPDSGSNRYQIGKYIIYDKDSDGNKYPKNQVCDYTYSYYASGSARTVTANNSITENTDGSLGSFTIDELKNENTYWSIKTGNATWIWDNQDGWTDWSTWKVAYGTTFEQTSHDNLIPIVQDIDTNIIALSENNKTKMTLQDDSYTISLWSTVAGTYSADGLVTTNSFWEQGTATAGAINFTFYWNCHPYETLNLKNFVDKNATSVLGEPVYITDGLPICKATDDGYVDITIKYMGTAGHTYASGFKNVRFLNRSGEYYWNQANQRHFDDTPYTTNAVNLTDEFEYRFDVKKGDVIWIKALDMTNQYTVIGAKTLEIKQTSNG